MKNTILVTLLTDVDTKTQGFCEELLNYLYNCQPELAPETMAWCEPIKNSVVNVQDALRYFMVDNTFWRRKHAFQCLGSVFHTDFSGSGSITIEINFNKKFKLGKLFNDLIEICNPKYAYVHLCSDVEFDEKYEERLITSSFFSGAFDKPIKSKGFNNLAWLNYFAEPYLPDIPVEKLKENGFDVENFHNGLLLKVSPNMDDVIKDIERFIGLRKKAKSLFSDNFFRKPIPVY
jgi:hypothetical protein